MNTIKTCFKALELMKKFGLHDWNFSFSNRDRAVGDCNFFLME